MADKPHAETKSEKLARLEAQLDAAKTSKTGERERDRKDRSVAKKREVQVSDAGPMVYAIAAEEPPNSPHYAKANQYRDTIAPAGTQGDLGRETAAVLDEAEMDDVTGAGAAT